MRAAPQHTDRKDILSYALRAAAVKSRPVRPKSDPNGSFAAILNKRPAFAIAKVSTWMLSEMFGNCFFHRHQNVIE